MPSKLPEHAVVSLLRQCFAIPTCRASRLCWQALSTSFAKPYRKVGPDRDTPYAETSHAKYQRGCYYAENKATYENRASCGVNSSGPVLARRRVLQPQVPAATQQEIGYSQGTQPPGTKRIAVLGGGITGLTSAHYLAKELPNAKITIYEGRDKVGGWLQSKYVDVENGKILFEQGPRTLRPSTPSAMVTLEMIQDLGLEDELLITPKTSDAAINRFVYYPDHLVRMPGPFQDLYDIVRSLVLEPVFKGIFSGIIFEATREARPANLEDESVASFLERRLGNPHVGNNIVSAVLHGIYAGDIYQLSAKSLLPNLWQAEREHNSITEGLILKLKKKTPLYSERDTDLLNEITPKINRTFLHRIKESSVYTFREGIGQLSEGLENSLKANPNVEFKIGDEVTSVEYDAENDGIKIKTAHNQTPANYTQAISTISGKTLSTLTSSVPSLSSMHAVTVMVANLYYPYLHLLPERGFGYLIPRSIPFEQNPECALGVVFDSHAVTGQDTVSGTKVTVMLGGHWWDGFSSYPDEDEGAAMAKTILHRHLKVDIEPDAVQVGLQRECIPQYVVGHEKRMRMANSELMHGFRGKLKVAGNSYTGVGLNDCVRAARDVVMGIKRGEEGTGLEGFVE